jgi:hypothetical protein
MTKNLSFDRPNRRDFLRTGIIGSAGLVVAQLALPKELRAQTITWSGQVQASSDDAEEEDDLGGIPNLTGTTVDPCHSATACGFRFNNVTIPNSATITAANVTFDVESSNGVLPGCAVYMQAADDPLTFTTAKFNVSHRTTTTNYGTFSATSTGWTASTDISAAVQEVVDRQPVNGVGGWASGNSMVVLTWFGPAAGGGAVYTWDFNNGGPPNMAAILTIQYM